MRLLIVEDDPSLGDALTTGLRQLGHVVDWFHDGAKADSALVDAPYDAVVLDLGLPGGDGMLWLGRWRGRELTLPVLILTARDGVEDRIAGLDAGADDYLVKPFDLPEFEARVRALLRRRQTSIAGRIRIGDLIVDATGRSAYFGDIRVELSSREFGVLETLARRAGRVVSKDQLLEALTGWDEDVGTNAIEVYVHRLRRKLEPASVQIRTLRGLGYLIEKAGVDGA